MLWCDVGLRFVTPVQPLEGEGGKLLSHRRVALRYLRTDLLVDVLCRWPWDACVSGAGPFPLVSPLPHATRHLTMLHPLICMCHTPVTNPTPPAMIPTTSTLYPLEYPLGHLAY